MRYNQVLGWYCAVAIIILAAAIVSHLVGLF